MKELIIEGPRQKLWLIKTKRKYYPFNLTITKGKKSLSITRLCFGDILSIRRDLEEESRKMFEKAK